MIWDEQCLSLQDYPKRRTRRVKGSAVLAAGGRSETSPWPPKSFPAQPKGGGGRRAAALEGQPWGSWPSPQERERKEPGGSPCRGPVLGKGAVAAFWTSSWVFVGVRLTIPPRAWTMERAGPCTGPCRNPAPRVQGEAREAAGSAASTAPGRRSGSRGHQGRVWRLGVPPGLAGSCPTAGRERRGKPQGKPTRRPSS